MVRVTCAAKLAWMYASPVMVAVVLAAFISAIVASEELDQFTKPYPSAAVAVIAIAWLVSCEDVPDAGEVVPPASGNEPMVKFAVAGISAKFAVTVASPVKVADVSDELGFATVAFAVVVQLTNV